ncbi:MAG: biopolymer transporter ExbD, partial [Desulfobacterales bacterium]|nr:biopolymer transporter ExbD [Desulfobacterales bacterium]
MLDTIFLIILLLLATLMHSSIVRGFPVNCPGFADSTTLQKENQAMEISVDKDGQIYVGKEVVSSDALEHVLPAQAEKFPAEKVLLRGDRDATYGDVAQALARVSKLLPDK